MIASTDHIHFIQREIGVHVGFDGTLSNSLLFAIENGMLACQVFIGGQTSFVRAKIGLNDILECQKIQKRFPIHVFSHFPFTASLCGSVESLAWCGDEQQNAKTTFVLKQLEYELNLMAQLCTDDSRSGVVIHPGCHENTQKGLIAIANSINKIKFAPCAKLILENSAGEGRKLCKTFEELATIFSLLEPQQREHTGVCIDTAHIHGQGDFDLSTVDGVNKMFDKFDKCIGLKYLLLVHLNDSEVKIGAKKDRHACLKTGEIWSESDKALRHLIDRCDFLNVPMILETDLCDMDIVVFL